MKPRKEAKPASSPPGCLLAASEQRAGWLQPEEAGQGPVCRWRLGSSSERPESIREAEDGINKDERNVSEEGYGSKRRGLTERMGRHSGDSETSPNSPDRARASGVWQQPG